MVARIGNNASGFDKRVSDTERKLICSVRPVDADSLLRNLRRPIYLTTSDREIF